MTRSGPVPVGRSPTYEQVPPLSRKDPGRGTPCPLDTTQAWRVDRSTMATQERDVGTTFVSLSGPASPAKVGPYDGAPDLRW